MVPSTFQQQNPGHPSSRPFQFYKNESAQSMTKAISVPLIDYPTPDIQMGLDSLLNDWSHSRHFSGSKKKNKTKTKTKTKKKNKNKLMELQSFSNAYFKAFVLPPCWQTGKTSI